MLIIEEIDNKLDKDGDLLVEFSSGDYFFLSEEYFKEIAKVFGYDL